MISFTDIIYYRYIQITNYSVIFTYSIQYFPVTQTLQCIFLLKHEFSCLVILLRMGSLYYSKPLDHHKI